MTDMQTSLPLLIVQPCILNSVMHFSTHLWPVKWNALQVIPLRCAFHFICSIVDATQAPTSVKLFFIIIMSQHFAWSFLNAMIHFISSCDLIGSDLNLTCSSPLCWTIGAKSCSSFPSTCGLSLQSLQLALHTCNRSIDAKPCLNLLHLATRLHVMSHMQWVPSSHYMSIASTLGYFSSMAHVTHTNVFVWTNHLYIST